MLKLVVLSCMVAVAAASACIPPCASSVYSAPIAYSAPTLTPYGSNYRIPWSLALGQPANILAADGRPLDTLDVNLNRTAHLTAKALSGGIHFLKKRSAPLIAPLGQVVASPLIHKVPLAYSTPVFGSRLAVASIAYSGTPISQYW